MDPERPGIQTDQLIASLAHRLQPVRPLHAPWLRALGWLALIALLCAWPVAHWARLDVFVTRMADPRVAIECGATLLTGCVAVFAAFHLAVPDRSAAWRLAALPPLAVWIACAGAGCLKNGLGLGPPGALLGESRHCFVFILSASVPLALLLSWPLRRARPLQPASVALCGALGVAALAAFALQFFHPFDTTAIDLALHASAVGIVVALATLLRRPALQ